MPHKYIDKVQDWLAYMSPRRSDLCRERENLLVVQRQLANGDRYKLHIWAESDDTIVFQSLVFRTPTGRIANELNFYQSLLMYNGMLEYATFAVTELHDEGLWGVTLNSVHAGGRLTAAYVASIVQAFDRAYIEFVPMLKAMAQQFRLTFDGQRQSLPL